MGRYPNFRAAPRKRRDTRSKGGFLTLVLGASLLVAVAAWNATPAIHSLQTVMTESPAEIEKAEQSAYYPNCRAARASGAAPIYRGSPGYRAELDRDDDGIACEPYR